jgi:hypothetical protein
MVVFCVILLGDTQEDIRKRYASGRQLSLAFEKISRINREAFVFS